MASTDLKLNLRDLYSLEYSLYGLRLHLPPAKVPHSAGEITLLTVPTVV